MRKNDMELELGILFAHWLTNDKGLDFDSYVEKYENDELFEKEINEVEINYQYKKILEEE